MRKKIALIGGDQIGQVLAMVAAQKELGDVVIFDVPAVENPVKGKALDLMEMAPNGNYDANVTGTSNYKDIEETARHLIALGVKNIAFNSLIRSGRGEEAEGITYDELKSILTKVKSMADEKGINMVWYSPTPYCEFNPVNYSLGIKQCTACSLNMAIEPDGTVIPCQSYYEPLGNILTDPWEGIWNHDLCKRIETQADDEQIPVSKLIEKLLLDAIREKTMYCSRCAFGF